MKRVLIASSVMLTLALAFLVYRRFAAHAPAPAPAAAHGEPAAPGQGKDTEPGTEERAKAAEPPKEEHAKAAEPPKEEHAKAAEPPRSAKPAVAEPRPRGKKRSQPDEAATAAIFTDRPAGDGEPSKQKTPRIPVLKKPSLGVAPPAYAAAAAAAATAGTRAHPGTTRAPAPSRNRASVAAAPSTAMGPGAPIPASTRQAGPGQPLPGAVSGTLRNAAGTRVAGASILAMAASGDDALETITDDDGVYLLAGMKPGRYLVFTGLGSGGAPALPARSVEVQDGQVARFDLQEPRSGATVRVRPLRPDGRPAVGQVLLVAGQVRSPATLPSLFASDAIYLPEPGGQGVLRHVPPGVYTVVLLQGSTSEPRVSRAPVTVRSDGDQELEVRNLFQ